MHNVSQNEYHVLYTRTFQWIGGRGDCKLKEKYFEKHYEILTVSIDSFLALLDCVSRAIAVARASVVRKTHFLRNRQGN